MSISDVANRNHERLFPNHRSTLKVTDPEFVELFDNFAFDEVLAYGNLDERTRLMVILAALIASQTLSEYKVMLRGALNIGGRSEGDRVPGRALLRHRQGLRLPPRHQ